MRKTLNTFVLMLFTFSLTANAISNTLKKKDCHTQACLEVGYWEDVYGDDLSPEDIEDIYQNAYNECIG